MNELADERVNDAQLVELSWVSDVALLNTHTNWLADEVCENDVILHSLFLSSTCPRMSLCKWQKKEKENADEEKNISAVL